MIERGVVLYRGRVLTYGKVWGHEDVILDDDLLQYARTDRARAMSFMEYRGLSREVGAPPAPPTPPTPPTPPARPRPPPWAPPHPKTAPW